MLPLEFNTIVQLRLSYLLLFFDSGSKLGLGWPEPLWPPVFSEGLSAAQGMLLGRAGAGHLSDRSHEEGAALCMGQGEVGVSPGLCPLEL